MVVPALAQHQGDWVLPQSVWAEVPMWEHCTHHGTWHSRGCPSWQGWRRRTGDTPGAGSVSLLTGEQKEGLNIRVRGSSSLECSGYLGCCSPTISKALGTGTVAPSLPLVLPQGGTLTTHQHRIHFISPKGGTKGCQLSLLRYQRRPKRHARGASACMESASSGTLLSGAAGKGTGRMPACGRAACGIANGGTQELCREDEGQERDADTWALLAAVRGVGTHRVGTSEPWALHLLAVHFTCGALQGGHRVHGRHRAVPGLSLSYSAWELRAPIGARPGWGASLEPTPTLQVQMAHLMRPNGGTTGCQRVPEPRHVLSPSK